MTNSQSSPQNHTPPRREADDQGQAVLGHVEIGKGVRGDYRIDQADLNEHFYIIGRSGTGKSNLLLQLALADAERGCGLCFIDPIGSTAEDLAAHLSRRASTRASRHDVAGKSPGAGETSETGNRKAPRGSNRSNDDMRSVRDSDEFDPERAKAPFSDKDIIYIDAADTDHPIGINPLYNIAVEDRARTVSDILQMFQGIWHENGWGPRMESIFRAALLTLAENPNVMRPSLITVFRLLLDETFRDDIKSAISDPQILDWWNYRFDRNDLNSRTRREWVEPVLNKIDAMSLDPVIRNIIGQPRCKLDFDEIVRRRQILIVNLNQNRIGQDNAAFIGMLILSRMRQAVAKLGKREEPFALTLDEAHTFPTVELTKIVNQGRHHGLFARIAHQNLEQFGTAISSTLRNGCGSLAVFSVGSRDIETIIDDIEPQHRDRAGRMIGFLGRGQCMLRLTRDGAPQPPSGYPITIATPEELSDHEHRKHLAAIRNFNRERFGTPRLRVEFQLALASGPMERHVQLEWRKRFELAEREAERAHRANARQRQANRLAAASERARVSPNPAIV